MDDVYSGFHVTTGHVDASLARTVTASRMTNLGGTAIAGRLGTSTGRGPLPTGRLTATAGTVEGKRPVTAVKAAGYVSSKSTVWRGGSGSSGFLPRAQTPSPAEVCQATEVEVHGLMEEAADLLRQKQAHQGKDLVNSVSISEH